MPVDVFMPVDAFVRDFEGSEKDKKAVLDAITDIETRLRAPSLEIGRICLSKDRTYKDTPHLDVIVSSPFEAFMNYAKTLGVTHIFEERYWPPERWDYWFRLEHGTRGYTATVGAVCNEQSRRPGFTYSGRFDD